MSDGSQNQPGDTFRLQQFGLKDTTYERPNQKWVCGHLSEGRPCGVGPDSKGRCLATSECHPLKKGDRWVCTRRDYSSAPCPCEEGPLPDGQCPHVVVQCAPVRSIRAKRERFTFGAFAFSIGILGFFLLGPGRSDFVVPGELTNAHAQVLKAHRAEDCAACHVAGSGELSQWLRVAFAPPPGPAQNEKCLACHLPSLGRNAALPHSMAASMLQSSREKMPAAQSVTTVQRLTSMARPATTTTDGQLACATCHQEHVGRRQSLAAMSDASCQACHEVKFESFAHGHPEFKAVPRKRVGIVFDHGAHESRMPGERLECSDCHRPDPSGRTMLFTSFETACQGCHAQGQVDHHGDQIRGQVRVIFQLPTMTPDRPGAWPPQALAPGSSLTPFMHFLVAGDPDPAALRALKSLDSDVQAAGSLDDWEADPPIKAQLVAAIKRVLKELTLDKAPTTEPAQTELLRDRIARAAGVRSDAKEVSMLLDELTAAKEPIDAWAQHCIPGLRDQTDATQPSTTPVATGDSATPSWKPPKSAGPWYVDPDSASVSYMPSHADAFDKSWIDVLAGGAVPESSLKIASTMKDGDYLDALRGKLLVQVGQACIKCHAVQPANGTLVVNWEPMGHAMQAAGYVKFDHRPHLTLFAGSRVCSNCHSLAKADAASPAGASEASLSFSTGRPNHAMAPHEKAECVNCHVPNAAPADCLTCHVYHMKD